MQIHNLVFNKMKATMKTTKYTTMKTVFKTLALVLMTAACLSAQAQDEAKVFYSWNSGPWNQLETWSYNANDYQPVASLPTSNDDVFIIEPVTITESTDPSEDAKAKKLHLNATLTIESGATVPVFGELVGHGNLTLNGDNYPEVPTGKDYYSGMVSLSGNVNMERNVDNYSKLSFNVLSGTVTFNNPLLRFGTVRVSAGAVTAAADITVLEDLIVNSGSSFTGNQDVTISTHGNIVASGSFDIGGTLAFVSTDRNQTFTLKHAITLKNILVDKGTTNYYADILAAASGYYPTEEGKIPVINLQTGSLIIGSNIKVAKLSTSSDFVIPQNAELKIAGGTVESLKSITVNGDLTVASGHLYLGFDGDKGGVNLNGGTFTVSGGSSTTTFVQDGGVASAFRMTAGELTITDRDHDNNLFFNLTSPNTVYSLSGGTFIFKGSTFAVHSSNPIATGGEFIFDSGSQTPELKYIAPFYSLYIKSGQVKYIPEAGNDNPFVVNGNFKLAPTASFLNSDKDLHIGGDLLLEAQEGDGNQNIGAFSEINDFYFFSSNNTTITTNNRHVTYNNVVIEKATGKSVTLTSDISLSGALTVLNGTLNTNSKSVSVQDSVLNNGAIIGNLHINGGDGQTMSGSGSYDKVYLDNQDGVKLKSDVTVNEFIFPTSVNALCNLNNYVMTVNNKVTNAGSTRFFANNTNRASSGLRLHVTAAAGTATNTNLATYHIGYGSNYAPAFIRTTAALSAAVDEWVTFNVLDPDGAHHPCLKTDKNASIYWVARSSANNTNNPNNGKIKYVLECESVNFTNNNNPPLYYNLGLIGTGWIVSGTSQTHKVEFQDANYALPSGDFTAGETGNNNLSIRVLYTPGGASRSVLSVVGNNWLLNNTNTTTTPQAGDILIVKNCDWCRYDAEVCVETDWWGNCTRTGPGYIEHIGKVIFERDEDFDGDYGRLYLDNVSGIHIGEISGKGIVQILSDFNSQYVVNADYSQFDAEDESSYIFYNKGKNNSSTYTINYKHEGTYPNVSLGTSYVGTDSPTLYYQGKLPIRGYLNIRRCVFEMRSDVECGQLQLGGVYNGDVKFNPSYNSTLTVNGNINFDFTIDVDDEEKEGSRRIFMDDGNGTGTNKIIVKGDIIAETGYSGYQNQDMGFELCNSYGKFVTLEFAGSKNSEIRITPRDKFKFEVGRVVVNKDEGSSVSFASMPMKFKNSDLYAASSANKAFVLQSGNAIFNVPQVLTLSSDGDDFIIPAASKLIANASGVVFNVGCNTGITLGGTLELNEGTKLVNQGHLYYKETGKAILDVKAGAEFSASQFCPDPQSSGRIALTVATTSSNGSFKIGGDGCMSAAAYGIFDIAEGSTITLADNAEVQFIDGRHNPNIADVAINNDEADCHFGTGAKFIFEKAVNNVWSEPIVEKEGYRIKYDQYYKETWVGSYYNGHYEYSWVDNPQNGDHHAKETKNEDWYNTEHPSGSDWEVTEGWSEQYTWKKSGRNKPTYTYHDKIFYYTYIGSPDHRKLLSSSSSPSSFTLASNTPLPNVEIRDDATVTLMTVPLTVNNTLTITSEGTLNANGKDMFLLGDFIVDGAFTPGVNTVDFCGTEKQTVGGDKPIKFYNSTISNNSAIVEFVNANTIANELYIKENANLFDAGAWRPITVETKYTNKLGTYSGEGGIALNSGDQDHTVNVYSTGTTSKLIVNNPAGVVVDNKTGEDLVISEALVIDNGLLNMMTVNLVLGENVSTVEGEDFGTNKMIVFESAATRCGVKKIFSGSESEFLMPFGVTNKYTPATIHLTEITPGASITIFPIDAYHPSIVEDEEYEDDEFNLPDFANTLKYYWDVVSDGVQNFKGWLVFNNQKEDYQAPNKGDGHGYDHYVAARLLKDHVEWDKDDILSDSYDKGEIVFKNFDFDNDANISGQYTAGLVDRNGIGSIPGKLKVYVTKQNGRWNEASTWAVATVEGNHIYFDNNGDAVIDEAATAKLPDTFECPERGSIVFVYHNVDVEDNGINVFHTTIGRNSSAEIGTVNLYNTKSHRFGVVAGRGRIITQSGSLPRGFYNKFVEAKGGTIEYDGETDYEINMSVFNNVEFSGSHKRILGPNDLVVNGYFKTNGDNSPQDKLSIINSNGATWNIKGDFIYNQGTFVAPTEGTISIIRMCGGDGQEMYSEGEFDPDVLHINILEVANSSLDGVHAKLNINIVEHVKFDDGVLYTYDDKRFAIINFSEDESLTVQNYNKDRFINGPLTKLILNEGKWTFPVGSHLNDEEKQNNRLGHFTVYDYSPGDNNGSGFVTVKYFYEPHSKSGEPSRYGEGIISVDRSEYWTVKPDVAGSTFGLRLRWDETSLISSDAASISNVCITNFDGENWIKVNSKAASTSTQTGTVYSDNPAVLTHDSQSYVYTLAHTGSITFNWTGDYDDNWFDTRNWSGMQVPTFTDFVIIGTVETGKKYPVINTSEIAEAKFLELSDHSSLTIKSGAKLTVFTDVVVEDGSTLLLETSSNLKDPDPNNNKVFHSLPVAGSLIYYGNYIGQATFQRFVRSYEFERLSIPVTGFNVSKFKSNAQVDAYDEGLDIDEKDNTTDEYYHYKDANDNNPVILSDGWKVLPNIDNTDITQAYRYICWPWIGNHALSFTGNPVPDGSTDFKIPVSFTLNDPVAPNEGYVDDMLDGWNYIPNPFLSAIDADKIVFNHVDKVIYTHDNISDYPIAYVVDGGFNVGVLNAVGVTNQEGSRYIPAGQSFFVHATKDAFTQGSGSVVLTKASRSHGDANMVIKSGRNSGKSEYEKIVFNTSAGGAKYQSAVYFAENATEAFDSQYDAFMQEVEADNVLFFYSFGSDYKVPLAANGLPHSVKDGGEIRLGYSTATAGTYTLYVPTLSVANAQVYLYDAEKETTTQLSEGFACKIDVAAGTNNSRFKLIFEPIVEPEPEPEPEPTPQPQPQPDPINDPVVIINPEIIVPDIIDDSNVPFDVDTDETDNNTDNIVPLPSELTTVDKEIDVKVYPVPSNGPVTVELGSLIEETGSVRMTLVSVSGRVIITKNVVDDKVELNIDKAGVYILRLQTPSKIVVKRVLIQ